MAALADENLATSPDATPATAAEIEGLHAQVPKWNVVNDGMEKLHRDYSFADFAGALAFANQVGAVAEEQGHHPQITFTWGAATVRWWSHSLGGLHRNDFIMAAKTDQLIA
jgi:4a-hydroxytetrahydrobiopterin dehydratase